MVEIEEVEGEIEWLVKPDPILPRLSWPILVSDWFNFEELLIKEGLEN